MVSLAPSLQPTERRIVDAVLADRAGTVERTAQELADAVGVGRTSVIRAVKTLGYDGFPQLRVALAQELALEGSDAAGSSDAGSKPGAQASLVASVRAGAQRFGARVSQIVAALTEESLEAFLSQLEGAQRVLVIANGLSHPLGLDLMMRLNAAGRPAEMLTDPLSQQISARQLGPGSVCVVVSGSGSNRTTLEALTAAKAGGARVLAITSFARSAVTELADVTLLVPPVDGGFHNELIHTSRAGIMLVIEQLIDLFVSRSGARGRDARLAVLAVLGGAIQE